VVAPCRLYTADGDIRASHALDPVSLMYGSTILMRTQVVSAVIKVRSLEASRQDTFKAEDVWHESNCRTRHRPSRLIEAEEAHCLRSLAGKFSRTDGELDLRVAPQLQWLTARSVRSNVKNAIQFKRLMRRRAFAGEAAGLRAAETDWDIEPM